MRKIGRKHVPSKEVRWLGRCAKEAGSLTVFHSREGSRLLLGDCYHWLTCLPDNSVDSVVTDTPYNLTSIVKRFGGEKSAPQKYGSDGRFKRLTGGFMGQAWDGTGLPFEPFFWEEILRVLKPGGYVAAMGGTRTYHRLAYAMEEAGFIIRDSFHWMYGSGFPKSHDISKAIDKKLGTEHLREIVGKKFRGTSAYQKEQPHAQRDGKAIDGRNSDLIRKRVEKYAEEGIPLTSPGSPEAAQWEGFGTAVKPAHEPVVIAQKPLSEKTIAENVLRWGTGAINIDGCRIQTTGKRDTEERGKVRDRWGDSLKKGTIGHPNQHRSLNAAKFGDTRIGTIPPPLPPGRWPANVLFSHSPGCRKVGSRKVRGISSTAPIKQNSTQWEGRGKRRDGYTPVRYVDSEGKETVDSWECEEGCPIAELDRQSREASRFFHVSEWEPGDFFPLIYTPKPSRSERDKGCNSLQSKERRRTNSGGYERDPKWAPVIVKNIHPTCKPVRLMEYLVRMFTPPGGVTLDPFIGSGTTGMGAIRGGFRYIGIDNSVEYLAIARARTDAEYPNELREQRRLHPANRGIRQKPSSPKPKINPKAYKKVRSLGRQRGPAALR